MFGFTIVRTIKSSTPTTYRAIYPADIVIVRTIKSSTPTTTPMIQ